MKKHIITLFLLSSTLTGVLALSATVDQVGPSSSCTKNRAVIQTVLAVTTDSSTGKPYYVGPVDGCYDSDVVAAVKKFQKDKGIAQTGNVGTRTRTSLINALKSFQTKNKVPATGSIGVNTIAAADAVISAPITLSPVSTQGQTSNPAAGGGNGGGGNGAAVTAIQNVQVPGCTTSPCSITGGTETLVENTKCVDGTIGRYGCDSNGHGYAVAPSQSCFVSGKVGKRLEFVPGYMSDQNLKGFDKDSCFVSDNDGPKLQTKGLLFFFNASGPVLQTCSWGDFTNRTTGSYTVDQIRNAPSYGLQANSASFIAAFSQFTGNACYFPQGGNPIVGTNGSFLINGNGDLYFFDQQEKAIPQNVKGFPRAAVTQAVVAPQMPKLFLNGNELSSGQTVSAPGGVLRGLSWKVDANGACQTSLMNAGMVIGCTGSSALITGVSAGSHYFKVSNSAGAKSFMLTVTTEGTASPLPSISLSKNGLPYVNGAVTVPANTPIDWKVSDAYSCKIDSEQIPLTFGATAGIGSASASKSFTAGPHIISCNNVTGGNTYFTFTVSTSPTTSMCPDGTVRATAMVGGTGCEGHGEGELKPVVLNPVLEVSNSASGPFVSYSFFINNAYIFTYLPLFTRTNNLIKANSPKGCVQKVGDTLCTNATYTSSTYRLFSSAEWSSNTTVTTSIQDISAYPTGNYEAYVMYPNGNPIKTGQMSVISASLKVANSMSDTFVTNGSVYKNKPVYVQIHGVSKDYAPLGCTQPVGASSCQNRANYRSFTQSTDRWADHQVIQTTVADPSVFPTGTYETWITYGGSGTLVKVGTFTLLNGTVSLSSTGSVLGAVTSCTNIPRNLHRGAESSSVTKLQEFLIAQGFLSEKSSGFYGDKTVEAVKDYQASKDLPVTGMVYEATRAAIATETCQ